MIPPSPHFSPYTPPQVPARMYLASASPASLAPAQQAGALQVVVGVVMLMFGTCVGSILLAVPAQDLIEQGHVRFPQLPPGMTPERYVSVAILAMFAMTVVGGALQIGLGLFVRRGGKTSTILSIVLNSLILLILMLNLLAGITQIAANPAAVLSSACFIAPAAVMVVGLVIWLSSALRAIGRGDAMAQPGFPMGNRDAPGAPRQQSFGYQTPVAPVGEKKGSSTGDDAGSPSDAPR